jgi:hypothetical protein
MRVLDTTRSLQTVLWQVNDLPGLVVAYTSTRILEQLLIAGNDDGDRLELWRYGLPQRRLYARDRVDVANSGELMLLNPAGGTFIATCFAHENLAPTFTYSRYTSSKQVVLPDPEHSKLKYVDVLADCLVLRMEGRKGDMDCWFVNAADGVCRARLAWPTLEDAKLRNLGASWLVFDGSGRLFHIDIETGAVHTLIVQ